VDAVQVVRGAEGDQVPGLVAAPSRPVLEVVGVDRRATAARHLAAMAAAGQRPALWGGPDPRKAPVRSAAEGPLPGRAPPPGLNDCSGGAGGFVS
jgi:hypothetical protein